jgi:hypothetical protein
MTKKRTKVSAAETKADATETSADETNATETTDAASVLIKRDVLWQQYCRLALNLHRSNKVAELETALEADALPRVAEPALMTAALHLVAGMAAAGVRRWDFLPAPTSDELADSTEWAARRLAEQRATQDAADRLRSLDRRVARALGQSAGGNGTIKPVHEQQSPYTLDELAERLESTMAKHQAEHGEFKREWLDHRSQHYIPDAAGGISNKQVAIMAAEITGSRSRRNFDANWKIVTDWLHERQAEQGEGDNSRRDDGVLG